MVTIFLVMRVMSLVQMSDPTISNSHRPIYKEETEHFGMMKLNDTYRFNFGVYFTDEDDKHIYIPEDVGRVISVRMVGDNVTEGT